jgi:hypothetical protein
MTHVFVRPQRRRRSTDLPVRHDGRPVLEGWVAW